MSILKISGFAFAVAFLMLSESSFAQQRSQQVNITEKKPFGKFLADGKGKSLYLFLQDSTNESTCYGACANAWPPLLTKDKKIRAGEGVNASLLGTVKRKDGLLQVTYNGHPLYYYKEDDEPGNVKGQDKDEYGEEWYLVKPNGDKMGDVD